MEQAPLVEPATPDAFLAAVSSLLELTAGRRIILAIDEFDSILVESIQATGHRGEAERIGDLIQALIGGAFPSLRLLLSMAAIPEAAGGEDLARLFADSSVTRLNCFPKADMDDMVREIIQQDQPIAPDDLEAIFQLAGGWPYYAKLLLECMADLPPTPDQVQRAVQAAVHHHGAGQTIANIYDLHFDEAQKQLVLLLALRGGQLDAAEWATASPALQSAAHQLASKDIVDVVADGGCRFRIGLLAAWFRGWSRYELELERRLGDFPFDGNALNT
ncbi:MAG: hypothetical protein IPK16_27445 [Anaerolineales bacterium]|nr:hypothetical protein [Anaerolineales bacterium]